MADAKLSRGVKGSFKIKRSEQYRADRQEGEG